MKYGIWPLAIVFWVGISFLAGWNLANNGRIKKVGECLDVMKRYESAVATSQATTKTCQETNDQLLGQVKQYEDIVERYRLADAWNLRQLNLAMKQGFKPNMTVEP